MKIKFKKQDIIEKLYYIEGVVSEKNLKEILSHILIEASSGSMTIIATNLETAIKCIVPAEVKKDGNISILSGLFTGIIKKLNKEAEVEIIVQDNKIELKSADNKFRLESQGFTKDDFPSINEPEFSNSITIPQALLKDLFKKTSFATLKNEDTNKPFLLGVYLSVLNDEIFAVGSDGFRLSHIKRKLNQQIKEEFSVIIPNKAVAQLMKILNSETGEVTIALSEKEVLFKIEDIFFLSRIIEEKFPKFEQVIPSECNVSLKLDLKDLERGLNLIRPIVDIGNNRINIELTKNKLYLKVVSDLGQSNYEINDVEYNGKDMSIPFNINYLVEFIKILETDKIFMNVINEKSPILFRPENDNNYIYITMPMRF